MPTARRIWEEELGARHQDADQGPPQLPRLGVPSPGGCIAQLESPALDGSSMAESEFEYTTRKITTEDLSNFSAWHGRSKLIPRLLDERGADAAALESIL